MPWKNGGGETIEIAISPAAASLDSFDWRVSMARVETPGPFSIFPDADRTLAVLDGSGFILCFATGERILLTPESPPFTFPADVAVTADLPLGGISDLNVMTRRGHWRHRVRRLEISAATALSTMADEILLLVRGSSIHVTSGSQRMQLSDGDSVVVMGCPWDHALELVPTTSASVFVIELNECGRPGTGES